MTTEPKRLATREPIRPYHVGVAFGLTTGLYAMSLLATTSWQIDRDRALIADRDPVQAAIEALDRHHDQMEVGLLRARLKYEAGSAGYATLSDRIAQLEAGLAATGRSVSAAERLGASLPTDLSLPNVPRTTSRGGSSGGGVASGARRGGVTLPPAPAAAAPPATHATTGASGAP
jgi:hypothetical protein